MKTKHTTISEQFQVSIENRRKRQNRYYQHTHTHIHTYTHTHTHTYTQTRQVGSKVSTDIYSKLNLGLSQETEDLKDVCLGGLRSTPFSIIFQLYHGNQFQLWRQPEYPERTTAQGQATGKLYHLRLRADCTFLCLIYKAGRAPTPYW